MRVRNLDLSGNQISFAVSWRLRWVIIKIMRQGRLTLTRLLGFWEVRLWNISSSSWPKSSNGPSLDGMWLFGELPPSTEIGVGAQGRGLGKTDANWKVGICGWLQRVLREETLTLRPCDRLIIVCIAGLWRALSLLELELEVAPAPAMVGSEGENWTFVTWHVTSLIHTFSIRPRYSLHLYRQRFLSTDCTGVSRSLILHLWYPSDTQLGGSRKTNRRTTVQFSLWSLSSPQHLTGQRRTFLYPDSAAVTIQSKVRLIGFTRSESLHNLTLLLLFYTDRPDRSVCSYRRRDRILTLLSRFPLDSSTYSHPLSTSRSVLERCATSTVFLTWHLPISQEDLSHPMNSIVIPSEVSFQFILWVFNSTPERLSNVIQAFSNNAHT